MIYLCWYGVGHVGSHDKLFSELNSRQRIEYINVVTTDSMIAIWSCFVELQMTSIHVILILYIGMIYCSMIVQFIIPRWDLSPRIRQWNVTLACNISYKKDKCFEI